MGDLGRVMALDVGDARIGVAFSDPLRVIASPHGVVKAMPRAAALAELKRMAAEREAVLVVAGLPLEASVEEGPQAAKVRAFMEEFSREIPLPVALQDERLTTVSAERMLISANMRRGDRRGVVDKIAAAHILQAWLDRAASRRGAAE